MMVMLRLLVAAPFAANPPAPDSTRCGATPDSLAVTFDACATQKTDTVRRRGHAIEYSEWYGKRLTLHRIGSYTMLPLFGAGSIGIATNGTAMMWLWKN